MRKMLILTVLLALFLVACGSSSDNNMEPAAESSPTAGALRPATDTDTKNTPTAVSPTATVDTNMTSMTSMTEGETTAVPVATATPVPATSAPPEEGYPMAEPDRTADANPPAGYPATSDEAVDNTEEITPEAEETEAPVTATGSTNNTTPVPPPTPTTDPSAVFAETGPTATTAEEVLREIFVDLQTNFGIEAGDIEVEEVVAGSWTSGALGCPQPDTSYASVITPGYMVTLVVGYDVYVYHTDDALNVVLCDLPEAEKITPLPSTNQ